MADLCEECGSVKREPGVGGHKAWCKIGQINHEKWLRSFDKPSNCSHDFMYGDGMTDSDWASMCNPNEGCK